MTRSSGPKWPCCRRMDRRTPTRTRTPLIEHRTHPSGDLDPPPFSLVLLRSFHVASLPLALSLSSFNLSITCKKSRLRTTEGGREWRLRLASQGGDTGEANASSPPPAPSERAACCSQVPTVNCTVRGQRPKRYAMQRAGPRVREDCWKEGRVGWRRCTL